MARGLPKKYAKMGFKKGWREFKKTQAYKGKKRRASSPKTRTRRASRRTTTLARKRRGSTSVMGAYGMTGALEDLAIGYIGTNIFLGMGYPIESAMPMTRVAQGGLGMLLNRRGKGRLAYGILDLIDVYLLKRGLPIQGISLKQWM